MVEILLPQKIGIALDVDGTLVDTAFECYKRTKEAWEHKYGEEFPLSYDQFREFRPFVAHAEDYFSYSRMMIENDGKLPENAKELNEKYLKNPDINELKTLFYEMRKRKMNEDKEGWIKENKVYEGVTEMMKNLGETEWDVFVATSKDKKSVEEILGYHGLDKTIKAIYDKDDGKRPEQFMKASKERGIEIPHMIPYDDLPKQLLIARDMGMSPIAAPQGYGIQEEIEKEGFPFAWPTEFIDKVERVIKERQRL